MKLTTIKDIQGDGLYSPIPKIGDARIVRTQGVVTALHRRGFFMQMPATKWDGQSSIGIFVYNMEWDIKKGHFLEVIGEVNDYLKHDTAKPVTQLHLQQVKVLKRTGPNIEPIDLTQKMLAVSNDELASLLNSLEGMLIRIPAGQTFIAPSNAHGDYVLALDCDQTDKSWLRSEHHGVIIDQSNPLRWFPGFRIRNYQNAPRLNVGSKLTADVVGPLNYRVDSYQLAVDQEIEFEPNFVSLNKSNLKPTDGSITVMTLNCFNLDPHIESAELVMNPKQDIDDDWGEGRFHTLAQSIVLQANIPDVVALQEIQDNDGAEITELVDASETYELLIKAIKQLCDIEYRWVDINPKVGEDGGQPGGNIRNAFLYNPHRVQLVEGSVQLFAENEPCYQDSRKPLRATFKETSSGKELVCINLHLASKRHQASIFAPDNPGVDAKLEVRVAQAECVRQELLTLLEEQQNYYVTGDFNDTEQSKTIQALLGSESINLVDLLNPEQRYDYNHRGKLQVLMHGIVSKSQALNCDYEIIHGNELIGVKPGEETNKPSDHAYVIAKLVL